MSKRRIYIPSCQRCCFVIQPNFVFSVISRRPPTDVNNTENISKIVATPSQRTKAILQFETIKIASLNFLFTITNTPTNNVKNAY